MLSTDRHEDLLHDIEDLFWSVDWLIRCIADLLEYFLALTEFSSTFSNKWLQVCVVQSLIIRLKVFKMFSLTLSLFGSMECAVLCFDA